MKNNFHKIKSFFYSLFLGASLLLATLPGDVQAQTPVELDLVLQPQLTKAQVLSLSNLGVDRSGQGAPLFNLVIRNNENREQRNLYLELQISSNKRGAIANLYQWHNRPFHLSAGEVVTANNNQLQNGLPGVEESIRFNGGLTQSGEDFINDLASSTTFPADIYTVTLSLYQGGNSDSGGELLDSIEESFGENISTDTSIDLYLVQPGGEVGSSEQITTTLPVFRWDGPTNTNYRLVIVEDNGQSPETLIQSALGSEPILENGTSGIGSLLDFEIVDARLNNITFSMPPSGVQNLEAGQKYYWQVFVNRETVNATENIPSEIWEFTVASGEPGANTAVVTTEVENSLHRLLGREQLNRLNEDGYNFNSIVIGGQTYQGAAAVQKLQELSNRIDNGEITIIID
ncbi:hypothetical protein NC796_05830 [Aliifodinibius sp. S!AR15-10]|uniref:hypothetical protein n=1 Tax=Aliifodinibius sp. S!AR15-10 TaxID=2950437 RepID=UPI00285CEB26|nr:hypothetical protein [Aliifodinibius sp. S!AR15-10]MDR8390646.1 hypothetical protein [Aliifodinibius sp. S!AR15-10]